MPGGLARVATDASINAVTTQRGGASKDIWVLPDPERPSPIPEATAGSARTAARQDLTPSRLVENLYWMGRYTVRCEDKAALLRATLAVRVDPPVWRAAVRMCQELEVIAADTDPQTCLNDEGNPYGLVAEIRRLNWCASQVRSRLSSGCWQAVSGLQQQLHDGVVAREAPRQTLDRLLLGLAALAGFSLDDMTQDAGWRLLRIGRRLERLSFVARLLWRHLTANTANHHGHVEWLLNVCDSLRIYRPRYVAAPTPGTDPGPSDP
ncbi:MAG: alpha-E domain-containing protein [Steroidobacteraceae bacterium]